MRILIVEDDALVAFSLEDALSEAGHHIVGLARDDIAAQEMAGAGADLALVDLKLARDASGVSAARVLREQYGIPSLFVSAHPDECRKAAADSGALGCVTKPFTSTTIVRIVAAIQAVLEGSRPSVGLPPNFELYPQQS
jgi:DNA-binding response OmpR family regulator